MSQNTDKPAPFGRPFRWQTRPHPNGDCIRACIATLLDLPIASVPDFTELPNKPDFDPAKDYEGWYEGLQLFLRKFGLQFVEVQLDKKTWMPLPCETLAIFVGPHPTGVKHAIVGRLIDGSFYPLFDPLGGNEAPLTEVEAVCLLVQTDPFYGVKMGRALEEIKRTLPGISSAIIRDAIEKCVYDGLGEREYEDPEGREVKGSESFILGPDGSRAKTVQPEVANEG